MPAESKSSQAVLSLQAVTARGKRKHERVRMHLLQQIASGHLRPGDALPAEHDLAELMGVSRTTIRQTLGDMEDEGYVRRVRGKGTYVAEQPSSETASTPAGYALVVPDVASGYYGSLLSAFEQASHEVGQGALICSTGNQVDRQAGQILRLLDQRAAGVVLNPSSASSTPASQVRVLQKANIPVVLLHRPVDGATAPLIRLSQRAVGREASQLIHAAGHKQVAFVASGTREAVASSETGFREALAEYGIDLPSSHVAYGDMVLFGETSYAERERRIETAFRKLLDLPKRPTAVFVSFDTVAEMAYLVLQRMGIRVPDDISLITFGGARREGAILQRLTTVTVDGTSVAQRAVQLIDQMRQGKRTINNDEVFSMPLGISSGETLKNQ